MKIEEIFEKALFENGYNAISDFLGYDYPADEDKDVTSKRIQEVIQQMPEEAFAIFFHKNVKGLVAYGIQWDVDMDELYEKFDDMSAEKAADILACPKRIYANMKDSERHDLIHDRFHHNMLDAAEFVGLPNEVALLLLLGPEFFQFFLVHHYRPGNQVVKPLLPLGKQYRNVANRIYEIVKDSNQIPPKSLNKSDVFVFHIANNKAHYSFANGCMSRAVFL